MLKRMIALLLSVVMLTGISHAAEKEQPAYEALSGVLFNIRSEPESDRRIKRVPKSEKVLIYEYGPDWCRVGYDGITGWCKTEWLWYIRSLDAMNHPLLGVTPTAGYVTLDAPTDITGGDFKGTTAPAGSLICVMEEDVTGYPLPVWRDFGMIPAVSGKLTLFAPWQEAQPGDVLAGYTTFFNEDGRGIKGENRIFNIGEGCKRIHGTVVPAGETFSFNDRCGPYTKKNGYLEARNIGNNGVGWGGGVCQVSTTLYNAVVTLPLQIEEWAVHRKIGVEYVPQYFDASVGAYSDLVFTNLLPYPIVIDCHLSDGVVTVLISRNME